MGGTDDTYRRRAEYFADLRIAPSPTSDGDYRVEITIEAGPASAKASAWQAPPTA